MNGKELRDYIDNLYFELKDNYERYGIEELCNSDIKEDVGGKFVIINEDGEYFYKEYLEEQSQKPMSLEDIAKRNIIKNTYNID